jgi:hypothetical protein
MQILTHPLYTKFVKTITLTLTPFITKQLALQTR